MADLGRPAAHKSGFDKTGQEEESKRDAIDDMKLGADQLVSARSLMSLCLIHPNDMMRSRADNII